MPEITNLKTGEKYNVSAKDLETIKKSEIAEFYDFGKEPKEVAELKADEPKTVNPHPSKK